MMSQREKLADPYYLYLKNYVVRACMEQGYRVSYLAESEGNYQALENELLDGILRRVGFFREPDYTDGRYY